MQRFDGTIVEELERSPKMAESLLLQLDSAKSAGLVSFIHTILKLITPELAKVLAT